jgi:microcompartment protein CcmL/EutN
MTQLTAQPVNQSTKLEAVGMIELTSIGIGFLVQDAMLKAADVNVILGRTICSGKYLIVVGGKVASIKAAMDAGLGAATDGVIDHVSIANVHPDVFKALGQSIQLTATATVPSIGLVETFSAASALEAADAAAKAAAVTLFRIHLAMALGGKAFLLMAGSVADCKAGVAAAAAVVRAKGLLVSSVVIPRPSRQLFGEYL